MAAISPSNPSLGTGGTFGSVSATGYAFKTDSMGTVVPIPGYGNSEFSADHSWNVLAQGKPLQLKLPAGTPIGTLDIELRAPDVTRSNPGGEATYAATEFLSGGNAPTVNWIVIAGTGTVMGRSDQTVTANDVNALVPIQLGTRIGTKPDGTTSSMNAFVASRCVSATCTLKLGILRPLVLVGGTAVPYLEYRITSLTPIPEQWIRISAEGYVRGFRKTRYREVEQVTTEEAMDFTVFQ